MGCGSYATVQPVSQQAYVAPAGGQQIQGTLGPGDSTLSSGEYVDRFKYTFQAGTQVSIQTQGSFDTYLIVKSPSGQQFDNDDVASGNLNSLSSFIAPENGEYDVAVTSAEPGQSGAYTLSVSGAVGAYGGAPMVNNNAGVYAPAQAQTQGVLQQGDEVLSGGEFADLYTYNFTAGQRVRISVVSSGFDTYLIVKPPTAGQMDNDDEAQGNLNAGLTFVAPESGNYQIKVTSASRGETGAYTLLIQ